jgi:hypothetical protein
MRQTDENQANNVFFSYVRNLCILWEYTSFSESDIELEHEPLDPAAQDRNSKSVVWQISFLSQGDTSAVPEPTTLGNRDKGTVIFEIRDQNNQFLGSGVSWDITKNHPPICEVIFLHEQDEEQIFVRLHPVAPAFLGSAPVTIHFVQTVPSAPSPTMRLLRGAQEHLDSTFTFHIEDTVTTDVDATLAQMGDPIITASAWYLYQIVSDPPAITIGQFVPLRAGPKPIDPETTHAQKRNTTAGSGLIDEDAPNSEGTSLLIEPRVHSQFNKEFSDQNYDNTRGTDFENVWQIHVMRDGRKIHLSNLAPETAASIATDVATGTLGVSIAHFHLRRWLAGHHQLRKLNRYSPFSQAINADTSIYSLFARIHVFYETLRDWTKYALAQDDIASAFPDVRDMGCRRFLYNLVKSFLKTYDEHAETMLNLGIPCDQYIVDCLLEEFSSMPFQDPAGRKIFERCIVPIARDIVYSALIQNHSIPHLGLNTRAFTPDAFDVFNLFRVGEPVPQVRVIGSIKTYDLGSQAMINMQAAYYFPGEGIIKAGQTLSPLVDVAQARANEFMATLDLASNAPEGGHTTTAAKKPSITWAQLPYLRRALMSPTIASPDDILGAFPGQSLRILTDPRLNFDPKNPRIDFQSNTHMFGQPVPRIDPAYWSTREVHKISNAGKPNEPAGFSDDDHLRQMIAEAVSTDFEAGWARWRDNDFPYVVSTQTKEDLRFVNKFRAWIGPNDANKELYSALIKTSLPKSDFSDFFKGFGSTAHGPIQTFLQISSNQGEPYGALLDDLHITDPASARAIALALSNFFDAVESDLQVLTGGINPHIRKLLQGYGNEAVPIILTKDMFGASGIGMQTAWVRGLKVMSAKLAMLTHFLSDAKKLNSHQGKLVQTQLLEQENDGVSHFDTQSIQAIYNKADVLAANAATFAKFGKISKTGDVKKPVLFLARIWLAALGEKTINLSGKHNNFINLLALLLSDSRVKEEYRELDAASFWTKVEDVISSEGAELESVFLDFVV